DVIDIARAGKADEHHENESDDGLDQPSAQFDQMVHQRRFGRIDLVFAFALELAGLRVHAARPPPLSGVSGCGAAAGSLVVGVSAGLSAASVCAGAGAGAGAGFSVPSTADSISDFTLPSG